MDRLGGGFVQQLIYFIVILGEMKPYSEQGSCIVRVVYKEANVRG